MNQVVAHPRAFSNVRTLGLGLTLALFTTLVAAGPFQKIASAQAASGNMATLLPDDVVDTFNQARGAVSGKSWERAESLYAEILKLHPDLDSARYSHALSLARLNRFGEAGKEIDRCLGDSPSVDELTDAAQVLEGNVEDGFSDEGRLFARVYYTRALDLALEKGFATSKDFEKLKRVAALSMETERTASFDEAVGRLAALHPDRPETHFYRGKKAAKDRQWFVAEKELLLAQELGMSADRVEAVMAAGVRKATLPYYVIRYMAIGIAVIGLVLGVIVLFHKFLAGQAGLHMDQMAIATEPSATTESVP